MIKAFFVFLNSMALLTLWMSCLACYVPPNHLWFLSFLGLGFPIILLINILFFFWWLIQRRKIAFFVLIGILLCWNFICSSFAFHFGRQNNNGSIKLMTYNVKNFDLYNWTGNKQTRANIMKFIHGENPDIICFQEFYSNDEDFKNAEFIHDSLGYSYFYFYPTTVETYRPKAPAKPILQKWGIAVFSKYEITDSGSIHNYDSKDADCMYVDLKIKNDVVRIYNMHLQSISLGYDDYDTLEEIGENQNAQWYRIKNILMKLKRAYAKRVGQANAVAQHIQNCKGKKIVCGDFNDVPISYSYHTISSGLQDAFVKKGYGFGKTFIHQLGKFRIDYTFFDQSIKINTYRTVQKKLSDHYPVVVTFDLQ
jgi:endonuclease/exonuclease/phosphatase family metal-dependent hydrolase